MLHDSSNFVNQLVKTCNYVDSYTDVRTHDYHDYHCERSALPSGFCEFHDENYFKTHQDLIRDHFLQEITSPPSGILFFIGCHIPDVKITGLDLEVPVYFVNAKFHGSVSFSDNYFSSISFSIAKFFDKVNFQNVDVSEFFDFSYVQFDNLAFSKVLFSNSTFNGKSKFTVTGFPLTTFEFCNFNYSNFRSTTFHKRLSISKCLFDSESDFSDCHFNDKSKFLHTSFHSNALFQFAHFENIVEFHYVYFKEQQLVTFDGNLSNVSFLESDISRVKFDGRIIWGIPDRYSIFDARELIKNPENFGLSSVLAVYRNLRENYEFRLMYEEAGQFFIKEMELKRNYYEDSKNKYNTKLKHISFRLFSLNSFYSYLCKYGESFSLPFIWSGLIFFLASAFYWIHPDLTAIKDNYSLDSLNAASVFIDDPGIKFKITIERTLASFFQIDSNDLTDYLVRISSMPILGSIFIVLRRRFERRFRH